MTAISKPGAHFLIVPLKGQDLGGVAPAEAPTAPSRISAPVDGFDAGGAPKLGGRPVDQFVGTGPAQAPVALSAPAPKGLDVSRYDAGERKKLDVTNDNRLDQNELDAAAHVADANGDGKIDAQEQLALDYLVGHDLSLRASTAFAEVQGGGRIEARAKALAGKVPAAQAAYDKANKELDQKSLDLEKAENEMRAWMASEGIPTSPDSAKVLKERLAGLPEGKARDVVEAQLALVELHDERFEKTNALSKTKDTARAALESAKIVAKSAQDLYAEAAHKLPGAQQFSARNESQNAINEMLAVRGEIEHDPKVREAALTYGKATAILDAVNKGQLDGSDVNVDKLKADIKASRKVLDGHAARIEKSAQKVKGMLEDPKFMERVKALPEDQKTQALTELSGAIADTEAGYQFYHDTVLPGLKGKQVKNPAYFDEMKLERGGAKLALNLTGVWGLRIANEGAKEGMKLMDAALARAIGVRPDQVSKVVDAIEESTKAANAALAKGADVAAARAAGDKAGADFLKGDKELAKIGGRLNVLAGGIAIATASLAAVDLIRNPTLRNGFATAKGATEIAEVIGRSAKIAESAPGLARFSKVAGRFGPALDVVVGGIDGYSAAKRKDIGGAIGGFTQAAGGVMGTIGVISAAAGATGVGLPLAVVGGVVATVGSLITSIWADSNTEKWLKDNAPEYRK